MGIRKGTKLTDTPKERTIRARIDAETSQKLDFVMTEKNMTLSEVIRMGIELQYRAEKGEK